MDVLKQTLNKKGQLILTLNRPDKLNALNDDLLQALDKALTYATSDSQVKVLIITGEGRAFCAGADISKLAGCDSLTGFEFAIQGQSIFTKLERLGKPSIAAINGYAFGGGCELCMATSVRISSRQAQFGLPEVKLGIIPGYGGTQRLARLVGKGRALDLCLSGRFINADTALLWGLVTHVVDDLDLMNEVLSYSEMLMDNAPLALKGTMDVIEYGYDLPIQQALHIEALHFSKLCSTEDKNEGVNAFLTKKKADFKGK